MALIPSANYPAQVDADVAYPYGKARNAGSYQDGTGTPLEQAWVNDIWGFLQALLDAGAVIPSGVADKVGASDYLTALIAIAAAAPLSRNMRASMQLREIGLSATPPSGGSIAAVGTRDFDFPGAVIAKGGTNGAARVSDVSRAASSGVTATATSVQAAARNNNTIVFIGAAASARTSDGSSWVAGGALTGFDAVDNMCTLLGSSPGPGTFFVAMDRSRHCMRSTTGATWSNVTTPPTFLPDAAGLAKLSTTTAITIGGDVAGAIKVAISTDYGVIWTAAPDVPTTALTSGSGDCWCCGNGPGDINTYAGEAFVFVRADTGGGFPLFSDVVETWATTDGSTWIQRESITGQIIGGSSAIGRMRAWQCSDSGLLVVATENDTTRLAVAASADGGRSWVNAHYDGFTVDQIAVAQGRIIAASATQFYMSDPLIHYTEI
jgi:hypothetical protein